MNLKSISKLIEIATVSVKDMPEKAKEAVSAMKPDTTETGYTFLGKPTTYVSPNAPLTEQIEAFKEKTENWMTIKK
ncbi:hypothetical protein [Enterobacter cloacae complex sp. 4DZ1-17B1]|uniref:hypothetical protein n=1 Tax=Enterobacter cloacae complex sp. 4DZ1-17B1 TaxID=2511991 RepID=UPI0010138307|nr:hypothetical protein [Enterobacter cloacae complex sp. 4DZ1-17B1]